MLGPILNFIKYLGVKRSNLKIHLSQGVSSLRELEYVTHDTWRYTDVQNLTILRFDLFTPRYLKDARWNGVTHFAWFFSPKNKLIRQNPPKMIENLKIGWCLCL